MNSSEYEQFLALLQEIASVYGRKLDDGAISLYWDSLKDQPWPAVERRSREYLKRGKFFPKPRDLRPLEADDTPRERDLAQDASYQAAVRYNIEGWDELLSRDPIGTKLKLAEALSRRYDCEADQGSTILAAKREWLAERVQQLRGQLLRPAA